MYSLLVGSSFVAFVGTQNIVAPWWGLSAYLAATLAGLAIIAPALILTLRNRQDEAGGGFWIRLSTVAIWVGLLVARLEEPWRSVGISMVGVGFVLGWLLLGVAYSRDQRKSNSPSAGFHRLTFFVLWVAGTTLYPLLLIKYVGAMYESGGAFEGRAHAISELHDMAWIAGIFWMILMCFLLWISMTLGKPPKISASVRPTLLLRSFSACLLLWSLLSASILIGLAVLPHLMDSYRLTGTEYEVVAGVGKGKRWTEYSSNLETSLVIVIVSFGLPVLFLPLVWASAVSLKVRLSKLASSGKKPPNFPHAP